MAADQAMIDGLTKHAATLLTLLVGGSTVKASDLITVLRARIAAIKAAIAAKAALMTAVAAMRDELAKTAALVSGARQGLEVAFAGHADQLGDFGLEPPKVRTPLIAEQNAAAAAKSKATRAANHPNAGKKGKTAATARHPRPVARPARRSPREPPQSVPGHPPICPGQGVGVASARDFRRESWHPGC